MKKIIFTALLAAGIGNCHAQISEKNSKQITEYFTAVLKGDSSATCNSKNIKHSRIDDTRAAVWACWRTAVEALQEDKLPTPVKAGIKDTLYWAMPTHPEEGARMPYHYIYKGEKPADGYPLFLYMHGSGRKQLEWETGYAICSAFDDAPSLYFIPQIPSEKHYRWAIPTQQIAWEKLLRLAFLSGDVDANRIFFFGISEGGYGSQRLASFYADYLAGAGPMAGGEPLKNAPMENVANIAFSLRTGALDDGFGRNILTQKALEVADELAAAHPGYYNHFIEVIEGDGHTIDYRPTTPWLAQFTRDAHPDYVHWENYAMYGRYRDAFYNIRVIANATTSSNARACYELKRDGNTIDLSAKIVNYSTSYSQGGIEMFFNKKYSKASKGKLRIYLNEDEYDLSQPVKVILNGTEIFNGMVSPTLGTMVESCALFYDPERLFPAAIDVDIAAKSAVPTSIESVVTDGNPVEDETMYDIMGRKVDGVVAPGIYIKNGRAVLVR